MRRLDQTLRTVATKEVVVTLVGESGTGKEVLARRVHELSDRRTGPFVPINCAAIPESLFESELFGHERGAFTGASERKRGKVEVAAGGTLFLDEIGEMPFSMQAKLLRFLEHRRFMRVGGTVKLRADVRFVFATLRPLEADVRAGRFRADLYYRIQGISLTVPPLRDRPADIPALVTTFMAQLSATHGVRPPRLTRGATAAIMAHTWPGNVRELKNAIESVCLLHSGRRVRAADLPESVQRGAAEAPSAAQSTIAVSLDEPLRVAMDRLIDAAVSLEGGNHTRAAARLGISVRTLQRRFARAG